MRYCKGIVVAVTPHSGCVEVTVAGVFPGSFPVDNCCFFALAEGDGRGLIGRGVEYRDGYVRFVDEEDGEGKSDDAPVPIPALKPAR